MPGAVLNSLHLAHLISFNPCNGFLRYRYCCYSNNFTNEKIEVQKGEIICPHPQSF